MGDPARGLELLAQLPLDRPRLSDVALICLGARAACRAIAGDITGASADRATIHAHDRVMPD
jgi:hypothetical protein